RVADPDAIELLHLAQPLGAPAHARAQLGILAQRVVAALVEPQVGAAAPEVLVQLLVLALALLPPGRDGRDTGARAVAEETQRRGQVRLLALRPEDDDGGG